MVYEVYQDEIIATRDNYQGLQDTVVTGRLTSLLGAPVDAFTVADGSGNTPARYRVYALALDGCKTFGTVYLTLRHTADIGLAFNSGFSLSLRLSTVAPTLAAFNPAGSIDRSLVTNRQPGVNSNTIFYTYRNPNSLFITLIDQGSWVASTIGYYRSNKKPAWWDEDLYPYVTSCSFSGDGTCNFSIFNSAVVPGPYTGGQTAVNLFYRGNFPFSSTGFVDNIAGTKDVLSGIPMVAPQGFGVYGITDNDMALCSATGLVFRDQVAVGSRRYTVLTQPTNGTASLLIRTL